MLSLDNACHSGSAMANRAIDSDAGQVLVALAGARHRGR